MKVTSKDIQNSLSSIDFKLLKKVKKQNLYIIKNNGRNVKVWSELEPSDFYKSLNLKLKK